jgi:ADP-ribosylglycohydrolase
MRILPLLFLIKNKPIEERFEITRQVSSVTHGHIRSVVACFYYLEFSRLILLQKRQLLGKDQVPGKVQISGIDQISGKDKLSGIDQTWSEDKMLAYKILQMELPPFLSKIPIEPEEVAQFDRLLKENIYERLEEEIKSTGYVIHTLEASIWCLLTTESYPEAVLKAVNLGYDTDTTAAVTGGLAGLLYGYEDIPKDWIDTLARKEDIEDLAERLAEKIA